MLGYGALTVYLSARGIVRPGFLAVLVANAFNGLAVWALVFGKLGMPAWGLWGASVATGLTRIVLVLSLGALIGDAVATACANGLLSTPSITGTPSSSRCPAQRVRLK